MLTSHVMKPEVINSLTETLLTMKLGKHPPHLIKYKTWNRDSGSTRQNTFCIDSDSDAEFTCSNTLQHSNG
eukprot:2893726-Lingulodinium_polyedra.AAC.1